MLVSMLLSGCGERSKLRALSEYIANLKKSAAQTQNAALNSLIQLPKPVKYAPAGELPENGSGVPVQPGAVANPLQAYPLKSLQFVGTLEQNGQIHAYIMTPDSMVYEAKEGDIIGNNYGKIVKIDSTQVEIVEQYTQSGKTQERKEVMQLKE